MIRNGFIGTAGAIVVAAVLGQAFISAQDSAAPKAPAKSTTTQKATPAVQPKGASSSTDVNMDFDSTKSSQLKSTTGNPVPATTPKSEAASGPADEPKTTATNLGSVHIPKKVMADGKALAAGTYMLRLGTDAVPPVTGQTASESRWVEFVQGGQVKGREIATVLSASEAKTIAKQGVPGSGALVQTLVGNDYLRVWVTKGGTSYLVHLINS